MFAKISSIDVAILNKVNELAERYGLKPYDFDASLDTDTGHFQFDSAAAGDKYPAYAAMLEALGCTEGVFPSTNMTELYDALDHAIRSAPRVWSR